ncbi:VOC family protein [Flexithrix dorotheae]|uniref:VOC family protein n=1 Tax=Flexithrix dorotheae TaxID=70993 RepID=UPI0003608D86|nr:VOC family protein [Flexithrix dorotheae]
MAKGKGRVTGIGGIFFKCENPDKMKEWYNTQLGLNTDQYGALFEFRKTEKPDEKAYLQWSPMDASTKYYEPSKKDFMVNYRVDNIEDLLEQLEKEGVQIVGELETFEYGKFAHIMDPEGNKIELWEPVDSVFTKMYEGKTTH